MLLRQPQCHCNLCGRDSFLFGKQPKHNPGAMVQPAAIPVQRQAAIPSGARLHPSHFRKHPPASRQNRSGRGSDQHLPGLHNSCDADKPKALHSSSPSHGHDIFLERKEPIQPIAATVQDECRQQSGCSTIAIIVGVDSNESDSAPSQRSKEWESFILRAIDPLHQRRHQIWYIYRLGG